MISLRMLMSQGQICSLFCIVATTTGLLYLSPFCPLHPASPALTSWLFVSMGYAYKHVCSLANLFQFPSPLSPLTGGVVSHVSTPLFPFRSSVYFVHLILSVREIIWYLFFSDWLILLLSIISAFQCLLETAGRCQVCTDGSLLC